MNVIRLEAWLHPRQRGASLDHLPVGCHANMAGEDDIGLNAGNVRGRVGE